MVGDVTCRHEEVEWETGKSRRAISVIHCRESCMSSTELGLMEHNAATRVMDNLCEHRSVVERDERMRRIGSMFA